MFKITDHKGFSMVFENGWTVSVQWGPGNYGDHHGSFLLDDKESPEKQRFWVSEKAEVAAWNAAGDWHWFGMDTVQGYMSTDEVFDFIEVIKTGNGTPQAKCPKCGEPCRSLTPQLCWGCQEDDDESAPEEPSKRETDLARLSELLDEYGDELNALLKQRKGK